MELTIEKITKLQERYGVTQTQKGINTGEIWSFEGSVGRFAMDCLKSGICVLPEKATYDYYGNRIPSRDEVKEGTTGSLKLAQKFWSGVEDDVEVIDALHEMFGEGETDVFN